MFNLLSEIVTSFFQKIALGGALILTFLGISAGETAIIPPPPAMTTIETAEFERHATSSTATAEKTTEKETQKTNILTEIPPAPETPAPVAEIQEAAPQMSFSQPIAAPEFLSQAALNADARTVVVNVFCLTKTTGVFSPITGSGVVIDARGVILTNAHVAQYLLLKDYATKDFLNCVIRGGSPAVPLYKVKLFLITESTRAGEALPASFPKTEFDVRNKDAGLGDPVLLASYPAGFLGGFDITKNLWLTSSVASIKKLYTFQNEYPYTQDAFSVGGTIVAQAGASGGGVFSLKSGKLIGLLATSLLEGTTDERDLRAVSLSHIDESIKKNTGEDLNTFLSGNLELKSMQFERAVAPQLTKILSDVLDEK